MSAKHDSVALAKRERTIFETDRAAIAEAAGKSQGAAISQTGWERGGIPMSDLGAAIAEKLAFNATRPDHKPEARAGANGKAY